MTQFAIGRYGPNDYRLVKWDGSAKTEIGTGWTHVPDEAEKAQAVVSHYDLSANLPTALKDLGAIAGATHGTTNKAAGHPFPWE